MTGSLTDVHGIRVGHHHRLGAGWQTGTTVVVAPRGAIAAVDVRGGGPGTRETDALDARNLVDQVHAVCLTGGSAYGLAAAEGVMAELERRQLGIQVGPGPGDVVPVVPAAVIFDLGRGGNFRRRPDATFGERATKQAFGRGGAVPARGAVGAGAGARAGGLQGGVGMASTTVLVDERSVVVSALAVVNASGSLIDPASGLPWAGDTSLRRPTQAERHAVNAVWNDLASPALNTTVGVVATDADLTRSEAGRMAQSGHDGLARAIRPSHALFDGDTIFALATGDVRLPIGGAQFIRGAATRAAAANAVFSAAADVFAAACVDALVTATTVGAAPAYRDLCASSMR